MQTWLENRRSSREGKWKSQRDVQLFLTSRQPRNKLSRWLARPRQFAPACWPWPQQLHSASSSLQLIEALTEAAFVTLYPCQHRPRPVNKKSAQIGTASLADTQQPGLSASGMLTWDQAKPCCQVAALVKGGSVADGSSGCMERVSCAAGPENHSRLRPFTRAGPALGLPPIVSLPVGLAPECKTR